MANDDVLFPTFAAMFHLRSFTLLLLISAAFAACEEPVSVPKPRTYPRVVYPPKAYRLADAGYCPFTFEQPVYASIERDTTFFEQRPPSDCWFNISIASLNAKIYCSYYPVGSRKRFEELVQDASAMTQKHNIKATYIEEIQVSRPAQHVYGIVYDVEGPAASPYQFFLTDSTRHFVRGALYFNTQARPDSLAPVAAFVKADVNRLIETLKWK